MSIAEPLLSPDPEVLSPQEDELLVSVVIPCLNEAANIERCVTWALTTLAEHGIAGEVVVADNDSDDDSAALAIEAGARVVHERRRGYGNAYMAGFGAARGRYIVMADADLTYDFGEIPRFLAELETGADLVMGDRMDGIQPGAMPWLHRYIGNPLLSGTLNLFFRTGVRDAHCGMRAFRRERLLELDLRTTGMEFASEMVIRAAKSKLEIRQLPIDYHPRGGDLQALELPRRLAPPALPARCTRRRTCSSSPARRCCCWALLVGVVSLSGIELFGREWQLHSMIAGSLLAVVGTQVLGLGLCAHAYGSYFMGEREPWFDRMRARFRLEHGLLAGSAIAGAGALIAAVIVLTWINRGFGVLSEERLLVAASALIIVGLQILFSSFLLSILGLRRRDAVSTDVQS